MKPSPPQPTRPRRARRRRLASTAAVLASAALFAGGCGDDDETTTDAEAEADRYVAAVEAAIRPVAEQSGNLSERAGRARSIKDLSPPLARTEQTYRSAARELERVDPPDEAAQLHRQLVQTHQEVAGAAEAAAKATKQGGSKELEEFEEAGDRYARRSKAISRRLGERGFDF